MVSTTDFLFLHGGGQGGWVWEETITALRLQDAGMIGTTMALDMPGCGSKRGRDTATMSLSQACEELAHDIDSTGVKDAILVGHSQAGTVMPQLAAARPHAVHHLVYVSCCAPAPGQTVLEMMGGGVHGEHPDEVGWPIPRTDDPGDDLWRAMFCEDMDDAYANAFLARKAGDDWPPACGMLERDWRYDLTPGIRSTFVLCLQDASLPVPWQQRFAKRFGSERIISIDAGHQVMNTCPHTLAEILRVEAQTLPH